MDENTITTVFRADISQFSSSTQQLNQYIKTVNSEFNVATSSLDKWSESTDGLTAKITQLNKVIDAEKLKLSDMTKRYDEMKKNGQENSREAKNLAIQINNQTAKVQKAEKETQEYSQALKELTDAGVKTKKELDELTKAQEKQGDSAGSVAGRIAKGVGGMVAGVAGMATGAVSGFLAMAESTREYRQGLNQLETAFGKVGFSAEETYEAMNYFGSVLGDTKKAQETMLMLGQIVDSEKELEKWTDTLTGVYATYGEAIPLESMSEAIVLASKQAVAEGGLADALEWGGVNLEDFNSKLESLNTEEERSAYIQKELNKLYGEAGDKYIELNKDILDASTAQTNLEHAMAQFGAVAEPIMTSLKNATAGFLTTLQPFVKLIGEGLQNAFNGSAEGSKKFAEGLNGIFKTLIEKANAMIPNVINILMDLIPALVNTLIQSLPSVLDTLAKAVAQIVGALGEMIPSIIQTVIDTLPQVVQSIVDALPLFLDGIMQLILGIVEALPSLIESLVASIPTIIQTIIDGLISFIPQLIDASITLLMAIVDAIPLIIEALIPQIPTIVNTIVDGLLQMLPVLLDGAVKLLMAIIDAIPIIIQKLIPQIPKIVTTIVQTLTSKIDVLIQGALQLLRGIIEAIPLLIKELIPQIPTIISSIVKGLIEGIPDLIKAGADMLGGIFEGFLDFDLIWKKIKEFGNSIVSGVKKFFGIESPSKLFRDEIGNNLALGIGEGFEQEIGDVSKEMSKSMKDLTSQLSINNEIAPLQSSVNWMDKLAELISAKQQTVVNNYNFAYKFEKMESTRYALHQAQLQTKNIVGG